jgi:hypothetical protein
VTSVGLFVVDQLIVTGVELPAQMLDNDTARLMVGPPPGLMVWAWLTVLQELLACNV